MSRWKTMLATLVVVAGSLVGLADPSPASAATTCYGGAVSGSYGDALEFGPYTTTSRCNDINMQLTSTDAGYVVACVVFINHTNDCNYWTYFYTTGQWKTIATDVRDGTKFKVRVGIDAEGGSASFKIAF